MRDLGGKDNPNFLTELINQFLSDTEKQLPLLKEAVLKEDAQTLAKIAHLLKGSSGALGAKTMQTLCARIQTLAESSAVAATKELSDVLHQEYKRVHDALEAAKQEKWRDHA